MDQNNSQPRGSGGSPFARVCFLTEVLYPGLCGGTDRASPAGGHLGEERDGCREGSEQSGNTVLQRFLLLLLLLV